MLPEPIDRKISKHTLYGQFWAKFFSEEEMKEKEKHSISISYSDLWSSKQWLAFYLAFLVILMSALFTL